MQKGTKKTRRGRKRNARPKSASVREYSGLYQRPGNIAEQYDDDDADDYNDDEDQSSDGFYVESEDSTVTGDNDESAIELTPQKRSPTVQFPAIPPNRSDRTAVADTSFNSGVSDGTGGHKADDENDSDLEII
jgi:hypothetical protein